MNTFRRKNVLPIAATHLLHDVFTSFFAPLLPILTEKLGFSYSVAGMLSVIQRVPSFLNPLIGIIADRMVIRSSIIAAPLVTIVTMSLIGVAPSVLVLGVLFFTSGISAAVYHVTAPVLMRQVSGDQIGKGMNWFMFAGELARTLGPLLITAAVSLWGLEGTWRLIPFGLVASLLLFINLRTIPKSHILKQKIAEKKAFRSTLRDTGPFFALISPILVCRAFSKTSLTLFLPSYLVAAGSSVKTAAVALAFLELAGAAGALLAGGISDRTGRKTVLIIIMGISPLLLWLFTFASPVWQWILIGLMGLLFFASTPVFMAMIHDLNTDRPSFTNGLFMTANFLAGSGVALLIGHFADRWGFDVTYRAAALLSLPAIPLTLFLKDKSR